MGALPRGRLTAGQGEDERMANVALKVYFVANIEFLIRTFVPPADLSYRYCMVYVRLELLAQLSLRTKRNPRKLLGSTVRWTPSVLPLVTLSTAESRIRAPAPT
jgi:hypothetical protein